MKLCGETRQYSWRSSQNDIQCYKFPSPSSLKCQNMTLHIWEQVFTKNGTNGKSFLESILVLIPLEDERESGVNECVSLLNRNRSFVEELCVTQQARETEVDFFQPVSSFSPRMYSPYWLHWHYKTLGEVSMWAISGAYCVTVIDVTSTDRVCI